MFRFTIRDVLWLTVVVALGVAWWFKEVDTTRRINRVKDEAAWNRLLLSKVNRALHEEGREIHLSSDGTVTLQKWELGGEKETSN
jgi:hypothetical protein